MAADGSALSTMRLACDEREDFAELLAGLSSGNSQAAKPCVSDGGFVTSSPQL
jgi:hypothetical protein